MLLDSWIFWSVLAAVMQSIRTAGQKYLSEAISPLGTTLVRYLFAAPLVTLYILWLLHVRQTTLPEPSQIFLVAGFGAGVLQILATVLLVRLLTLKNFAVGSCYIRTEVLATAVLGLLFFGEQVSSLAWLAMMTCVTGLVLISIARSGRLKELWNISAAYGLGAGIALALTSLLIRQASLSFGIEDAMFTAALTLGYMILIQTILCLILLFIRDAGELLVIFQRWRVSLFVGVTSLLGSIGWFTAFTMERAAYVRTIGQVEFLVTLAISILFFKERPNRLEWIGMLILVAGVLALLLAP